MKRLLACIMILCLLCGQAALGETAASEFTKGIEFNIDDFAIVNKNEPVSLGVSIIFKTVMNDDCSHAQLSFTLAGSKEDLMVLWIEQFPDQTGYASMSNQKTRMSYNTDIGKALSLFMSSSGKDDEMPLSTWLQGVYNAFSDEITMSQYINDNDQYVYSGNGEFSISLPEYKMHARVSAFEADGPLFDMSDRKAVEFTSLNDIMSIEGFSEAITECSLKIMQDPDLMKALVVLQGSGALTPSTR